MTSASFNNTQAFLNFLKSRQTGLTQKSSDWVKARQHTIGASEISALTGSLPFETQESYIHTEIHTVCVHLDKLEVPSIEVAVQEVVVELQHPQLGQLIYDDANRSGLSQ